jgi:hypothetical protein
MRKFILTLAVTSLSIGAFACGHETRTVVRRETVQTETVPAPVVVERRTIIEPAPVVPQERIYQERRTTIEHE